MVFCLHFGLDKFEVASVQGERSLHGYSFSEAGCATDRSRENCQVCRANFGSFVIRSHAGP